VTRRNVSDLVCDHSSQFGLVVGCLYQPAMNASVTQTLLMESRLRQAVEREEFVLHYQPKYNLVSGKMSGMEALIRWNHPTKGLVPPEWLEQPQSLEPDLL